MDRTESLEQIISEYGVLPPRFYPVSIIGRGAYGLVLQANDRFLERDTAIKILDATAGEESIEFARFTREAKLLSALDHKHIVRILSSGLTEKKHPFLVLELLKGQTLDEELKNNQVLSTEHFFQIFVQILEGLNYAHSQQIVHRDIKPSNLMLCRKEDAPICAKLIDFGIARQEDTEGTGKNDLTRTGTLIGTPLYMSPEQCKGEKAQAKSDIYSLACVMYQCLTGSTPFFATSSLEIMYKHIKEDAPALSATAGDTGLTNLIADCLKKSPDERPATDAVLVRLKELSQEFSGKQGKYQINKESSRSPFALLLILTLLLLSSACLLSFSMKRPSAQPPAWSRKDEVSRKIELLREDIERIEKRFDRLKDSEERTQAGVALCKKIDSLCQQLSFKASLDLNRQNKRGWQKVNDERASLFRHIISICDSLSPDETLSVRIDASISLSEYERCQKHYQKARQYINQVLPDAKAGGANDAVTDLVSLNTRLEIECHDLKQADHFLNETMSFWREQAESVNTLKPFLRRNQGKTQDQDAKEINASARSIIEILANEQFDTPEQKEEALNICNKITVFFLQTNPHESSEFASAGLILLAKLPSNSKNYKNIAAETYRLAEKNAALHGDEQKAALYRSLAAQ